MEYRLAEAHDLPLWLEVAQSVGDIMRCPHMETDPLFLEYATRKLGQGNAILAFDETQGRCAGFIGFSLHNNSITWLGVHLDDQKRGIGSRLLLAAMEKMDPHRRITLNTYPKGYLPGHPARRLYAKHGFVETTGEVFLVDGYEMVAFHKEPRNP